MKKFKIKASTIARIVALAVALANQCMLLFGQEALPITGELAYQLVSTIFTVVIVAINAWFNNDFTVLARLAGRILDALKDGKVTPEEVQNLLYKTEDTDKTEE